MLNKNIKSCVYIRFNVYIYIYVYYWVGTSTVPKNIKGFGYISSRCPFFLSCTCAIRLHQDFSRQAVANMKCKMVLVSTSYTMTRWIPDRCAHDLHSLSTFVSPESWWKSLFRNLDRWTARMSYSIIRTAGLYAPRNPTTTDLAQSMPAQSRWAGFGLSIALIAGLKLGSSKSKRFTSR